MSGRRRRLKRELRLRRGRRTSWRQATEGGTMRAGDPYLDYVDALATALMERDDERVRDLLADAQATVLPRAVVEEAQAFLLLPSNSFRTPLHALRHLARTEERLVEEAERAARRAGRRLEPRVPLADSPEPENERATQLELDLDSRRYVETRRAS